MKKRALAIVLATAVLLTFVLTAFTASAAPSSLADYESYTLTPDETAAGFSLETTAPISGTKSLAYNLEGAGFTWIWNSRLGIENADWSGYDYFGIKVKNTSTTQAVAISFLIDMNGGELCRYIPTTGGGLIMADADEQNVTAAKMVATATAGVGCPYVELAPGFTGTLYIPLKVDASFENPAFNSTNAPYNNVTALPFSMQAAADYSGSVLFDDAALYTAADVPDIIYQPVLLTDYENNSAASEVINGVVPEGTSTYEIITTGALNGSKSLAFSVDPQGASVGQDNIYMKPIGGITQYANYSYLAIRMKNTDTANDIELNFMFDRTDYELSARQTLTSAENSVIMRTVDNKAVEASFSDDIYLNIPAGFDGTVYFPIAPESTVSEMYVRLRPVDGEYSGKLIWDDPTLLNEDDIPEANEPQTSDPGASAPVTTAPTKPGDPGSTGSALMLMPAMAAAASAVVVLRKRKA